MSRVFPTPEIACVWIAHSIRLWIANGCSVSLRAVIQGNANEQSGARVSVTSTTAAGFAILRLRCGWPRYTFGPQAVIRLESPYLVDTHNDTTPHDSAVLFAMPITSQSRRGLAFPLGYCLSTVYSGVCDSKASQHIIDYSVAIHFRVVTKR